MENFQPGPYTQGTKVISNGIIWQAKVNITYARALPSANQYWLYVGPATPPPPQPIPEGAWSLFIEDTHLIGNFTKENPLSLNMPQLKAMMTLTVNEVLKAHGLIQ